MGIRNCVVDVQHLKKEMAAVADSPNRLEPEMIRRALHLLSQIFIAEHPDAGNGTMKNE